MSLFFENHSLLDSNQGFRKNISTINSKANYLDNIYEAINDKQLSLAVYIDFSKAFDTVNHQIEIESYRNNRKQRAFINNTYSDYSLIEFGVPQGSTLGPLLFLVYINDLRNCLTHTKSYLYADYTVLVESCIDIYLYISFASTV